MFKLFNFAKLGAELKENVIFMLQFVGIIAAVILFAFLLEKLIQKKNGKKEKVLTTRKIAVIGVMSAIASVLMLFEFPIVNIVPFYKLDLSELPILLCAFAYGPMAGVIAEAVKIFVNLLLDGTTTAFVGELANFIVGSTFVITASTIYHCKKNKTMAIIACVVATVVLVAVAAPLNGIYLVPKFAEIFGMPLEAIIAEGTKINPKVDGIWMFVLFNVVPINLLKGVAVSLITILLYHPLRPILKKTV
jgi:riboflavin transporter FmnP